MIKITALLLAVLLSLAIIPTVSLTPAKAQNDTSANNVTSSVNQTITNETTIETNTTIPTEPGPGGEFPAQLPVFPDENVTAPPANETAPPEGNETAPPVDVEETLPPGNVSQAEPTAIQIQLIPNIQRGHNQHMTLFLVDDQGGVVLDEPMQANITNERGQLVGLKSLTTESGQVHIYKVGPNTNPQNITVFAQVPSTDITAQEEYSVFAKITPPTEPNNTSTESPVVNNTLPIPEPLPPSNETAAPPQNQTVAPPTPPLTPGAQPGEGNESAPPEATQLPAAANSSVLFEKLQNATAILSQEVELIEGNANANEETEVRGIASETLAALGGVASQAVNATNDQLELIRNAADAIRDGMDAVLDED